MASLLPYTKTGDSRFYINFLLDRGEAGENQVEGYPFTIVSDTHPTVILLAGEIVSDARIPISRVFLMMQKTDYAVTDDEHCPLTNTGIDRSWQDLFSAYPDLKNRSRLLRLAEQVGGGGDLLPFKPLLFCRTARRFFHPSCPQCGTDMDVCRDDALLAVRDLQSYSGSLRRYLVCSDCALLEPDTFFYVSSRKPYDPRIVRDQWQFLQEFRRSQQDKTRPSIPPCGDCSDLDRCLERCGRGEEVVTPFSFYPFFAFALDAPHLCAVDFLSIVSGASIETVEHRLTAKRAVGRIDCLRHLRSRQSEKRDISDGQEQGFNQVLYIKLSFLKALLEMVLSDVQQWHGEGLNTMMDRIWVELADPTASSPALWGMKIRVMGIDEHETISRQVPTAGGLCFHLAAVWLYTLVGSRQQTAAEVNQIIIRQVRENAGDGPSAGDAPADQNVFYSAEDIFWDSGDYQASPEASARWQQAMAIGLELAGADQHADENETIKKTLGSIDQLMGLLKNRPENSDAGIKTLEESKKYDYAINDVLQRIRRRLVSELNGAGSAVGEDRLKTEGQKEKVVELLPENEFDDATIIIDRAKNAPPDDIPQPVPAESRAGQMQDETVLIRTAQPGGDAGRKLVTPPEDIVQETIILRRGDISYPQVEPVRSDDFTPPINVDEDKTIIIRPGGQNEFDSSSTIKPSGESSRRKKPDLFRTEGEVDKTVIIRRKKNNHPR